ncbi:hypothetical protein LPJ72_004679, partial [Coemansia sp. Benny D160-2]
AQASTTVWQPAYSDYSPQWAFGYGLGYSSIAYSSVAVSSSILEPNSSIEVSVTATNNGPYAQKETVMLFTSQPYHFGIAAENNRLRKFTKISLDVGQTKEIKFTLAADDLAFWNGDLKHGIQADAPVTLQINPYTLHNTTTTISLNT